MTWALAAAQWIPALASLGRDDGRVYAALACILALTACDASGPRCETIGSVALSIDPALYAPEQADGAVALTLRYRDFAAAGDFDPQELADPAWSIERSTYATRLTIARVAAPLPNTVTALRSLHPGLTASGSDWQPWRRFKECPIGCEHVFYLNEDWSDQGLGYLACEFVENRNPFLITCTAHDTVQGLQVAYSFPAAQKEQFPVFRARIAAFLSERIAIAAQACD